MSMSNDRATTLALTALRIAAGLAFAVHGAQKLFGWFGGMGPDGGSAELASRLGVAGIIEFGGGLCIALGLLTRPAAFIASGQMAVAYFWVHTGGNGTPWWWANGGELALLYSFLFLFFAARGAGPYSVDGTRRPLGDEGNRR